VAASEDKDRFDVGQKGDEAEARGDDVEGHGMEHASDAVEGMEKNSDEPDFEGHAMTPGITPNVSE